MSQNSTQTRPVLAVIDIQREYTTPGRSFYLETAGPSLENASRVLAHARKQGWDIVHVRHLQTGTIFNPESPHSRYVEGFEPHATEVEAIKSGFSSYSSPEFGALMERWRGRPIHVIGYGSTMCCLSTIVDGYHRGHKFVFVSDASCARKTQNFDEQSTHAYASDILSTFAAIATTAEVLGTADR